jgi:predicted RNA-binding Zn-ribbon protein involved in translation (DUF1610 family)
MEDQYWTDCDACDVETTVSVGESEEVPLHCPMCGHETEYELVVD